MIINRTSKCYFNKYITKNKLNLLKHILDEYSKICNYFVKKYEDIIPNKKRFDLSNSENIKKCISETETFLSARLIKIAFDEAYGAICGAKSNSKNRIDKKYFSPVFYGKKMTLSENCCEYLESINMIIFDANIKLKCLRKDLGRGHYLNIPIKKHKQFNKWYNLGKMSKTITITNKYAMVSFSIETGPKKTIGNLIGVDFGIKKLCTLSDKNIIGKDIKKHLYELQSKKNYSKGYYRKKQEIKEYINREIKDINFKDKQLVVVENLKNMKYKMNERGRLSKNIRSIFYNLSYRQVLNRIQMLCEENRVTFRSVNPYYTSQECSICGHIEKGNRLTQESFICQKCGHSDNADLNASKVILKRFTMGTYGSHYKTQLKQLV